MRVQTEIIFPNRPYFPKKIVCPLNVLKNALKLTDLNTTLSLCFSIKPSLLIINDNTSIEYRGVAVGTLECSY